MKNCIYISYILCILYIYTYCVYYKHHVYYYIYIMYIVYTMYILNYIYIYISYVWFFSIAVFIQYVQPSGLPPEQCQRSTTLTPPKWRCCSPRCGLSSGRRCAPLRFVSLNLQPWDSKTEWVDINSLVISWFIPPINYSDKYHKP